jgi:hypothetical protein
MCNSYATGRPNSKSCILLSIARADHPEPLLRRVLGHRTADLGTGGGVEQTDSASPIPGRAPELGDFTHFADVLDAGTKDQQGAGDEHHR